MVILLSTERDWVQGIYWLLVSNSLEIRLSDMTPLFRIDTALTAERGLAYWQQYSHATAHLGLWY